MLARYGTDEMRGIWSEEQKFRNWIRVEVAVLRARVKTGELSIKIPDDLEKSINIDVAEINRIESEVTKHDVIAFLMHTSEQLPEEIRPYWHHKMTSYDTQDTALSLQLGESIDVLMGRIEYLAVHVLKKKAYEYKNAPQIGRSHGVHAEPITFGVKIANWCDELSRHWDRLKRLKKLVAVGKISGAVGMYTLDPEIEKHACEYLGLEPIITTQIISRDIIAEYVSTLAIIGGTIEKICVNLRTLQRTEILETQEFFSKDQRGSSAMPHKRNPIGSENLSGMARVLRGYVMTAMENQNTWDERDIANSGPERIILPDASTLLDYMLVRLSKIMGKLLIYPDNMLVNINLTKGLVFSQDVQSLMAKKSRLPREDAYKIIRDIAQRCWDDKADFMYELRKNVEVSKYISDEELESCFDLNKKIRHTDHIFNSVFNKGTKNKGGSE